MRIRLFIIVLFIGLVACEVETPTNDYQPAIQDTVKIDSTKLIEEKDSVFEKMSVLMQSTENAHKKVHQIQVLKSENKELKADLIETKEELTKATIEIKKLDSVVNYGKKKTFIQKIVDTFKDTTKTEN